MPKQLQIVVGLMFAGMVLNVVMAYGELAGGTEPALVVPKSLGIVVSLGLIHGFRRRSVMALRFTQVLSIIGLLACFPVLVVVVPAAVNGMPYILLPWICIVAVQSYVIWAVFSMGVRGYFGILRSDGQ